MGPLHRCLRYSSDIAWLLYWEMYCFETCKRRDDKLMNGVQWNAKLSINLTPELRNISFAKTEHGEKSIRHIHMTQKPAAKKSNKLPSAIMFVARRRSWKLIRHMPMHLMLFHTPSISSAPLMRQRPVFLPPAREITRLSGNKVSRYNRHRSHTARRSGSPAPSHTQSECAERSDGRDDECKDDDDYGDDGAAGERAVCAV